VDREELMKIGFLHLLTLVFVMARLFDKIDWSWWAILSPSILAVVLGLAMIADVFFLTFKK
jgi:hypothetical protein